ncbi:unnamed protein product [marine sediment metagenome]|uniref:Uncharacterized protein n=1 Tax=marine sediment metagenome TaxID=412755 RepID=X0X4K8_9ZZZZ
MAKFLPFGGVTFPSQGSTDLLELVKHFSSSVDFDDLQDQINTWLLLINSDLIENRPAIRNISFNVIDKTSNPNKGFNYFAQVHYILLGDADDSPNL